MNNTMTVKNSKFTTQKGNSVVVFDVKRLGEGNGVFQKWEKTVETFAMVNETTRVECFAGEAFRARECVEAAGF